MSPPDADVDAQVAEAAYDLYGLPPGEFTAERDRLVREARDAGDRALAATLQSLKRPTVAAWAVNLLVREEADLLRQVLDIGEALREAQAGLEGDALRELGRQRRDLISSVVARARALLADEGGTLNGQAEQQVAATLQAALTDPAAADAVLTGLLTKPLESTGLGSVDVRDHVASLSGVGAATSRRTAPRSRRGRSGKDDEEAQQAELREQAAERRRLKAAAAQERVDDAAQAVEEAERARDGVRARHEEARAHVLHLEARIDELRRRLAQLESEAEEASEQVESLEQELEEAEAEVASSAEELTVAREALSQLG